MISKNNIIKTIDNDKHNLYNGDKFKIYDNEFEVEEVININEFKVKKDDKLLKYYSGDKIIKLRKQENYILEI